MVLSTLAVLLQVDPAYTGRVGASEAALFLKKSGLSDIILGKVGKMKMQIFPGAGPRHSEPLGCSWWV